MSVLLLPIATDFSNNVYNFSSWYCRCCELFSLFFPVFSTFSFCFLHLFNVFLYIISYNEIISLIFYNNTSLEIFESDFSFEKKRSIHLQSRGSKTSRDTCPSIMQSINPITAIMSYRENNYPLDVAIGYR